MKNYAYNYLIVTDKLNSCLMRIRKHWLDNRLQFENELKMLPVEKNRILSFWIPAS